ncbi:DUF2950 domain-containing protein [Phaeobacter gallaeciensis]|uniref:DUF2950 domain-containing protein n=2 Tax=Phaeobacter gallaeciensis TaxID=60890 RepID=A0A366WU22_9RHOB|nr:DUF2950 domain-containing protein [Phaeobacter gallaeciensis]
MYRTMKHTLAALALLAATPAISAEEPATYQAPQDALEAMMQALSTQDTADLLTVFGTDAEPLLSSGNPDRDKINRLEILVLVQNGYRFQPDEDGKTTLLLGVDSWPFPIPLHHTEQGWSFDIEAGANEVHTRRIGLNELDTIETLHAYVDIQAEYRLVDHDGDGVMEFARALLSSPGRQDGLFWGRADSPLGERIALASLDGYNDGDADQDPEPFGGYYYRVLQGQGDAAPGGAMNYLINDQMVAGHAMLAVPSDYGNSGITSFLVAENGTVYEADLGEDTLDIAQAIILFDPDSEWSKQQ